MIMNADLSQPAPDPPPPESEAHEAEPHKSEAHEIVIVGGGIIGMSIAWELANRGQSVVLLERRSAGSEDSSAVADNTQTNRPTSWTASGILPPANFEKATDPLDRLRGYSHQLWPKWAEQLGDVTGIDVGLMRCGGYYLAETVGEAAAMGGMTAYWKELDIECEALTRVEVAERLPRLSNWIENNPWMKQRPDLAAWWVPDEHQIRPSRVLKALYAACVDAGVRFVWDTLVTAVDERDHQVKISTDSHWHRESFSADRVVLCGGAATGYITPTAKLQNALIPVRGQILLLHSDHFNAPAVLNIGNRYLVFRGDGHVLVGSCEEEAGFAQQTTAEVIDHLRQFAGHVCSDLADAPEIQRWAGLRPMTFDGFPLIGRQPNSQRVYVASGHYRSGIHLAPATATAMADIIERKSTFMDMSPFSVGKQQEQLPTNL
ncbi:MAG: NAD(P)/FAD-dependent oxidoreductase [Rhodopirellula sp. JB044]|uniref:NAD(P)/FAD-dependent oxidoreductase n=1 Tax=Rhodopirellula sp. JB044 TaxID=3342844 RepID=UPI00370B793E